MAKYTEKEVLDVGLYEPNTYGLKVVSGSKSKDGDPLSYTLKFTMTGPPSHIGRPYTERFALATEDDPNAEQSDTKRSGFTGINWGRWKSLVKATGLFCGDSDEEFDALVATKPDVLGDMTKRGYEAKDGSGYKGPFNNLARFYAPGKKEVKELPDTDPSQGSATSQSNSGGEKPSGNTSNGSGKPGTNGQPASSAKVHCDECDRDVPKRLYDNHMKRHEAEAGGDEEE